MTTRRPLSDEDAWTILCEPDTSSETLGRRLGIKPTTIRNARARFRAKGWTCRVAYVPCHLCGEVFVQQGLRTGRMRYHNHCRDDARREINRRLDDERWSRMSQAQRTARLDRAHRHRYAHQATTTRQATNRGARWTAEEDAYLMTHRGEPAHQTALALGRSLYAIETRRRRLDQGGQDESSPT